MDIRTELLKEKIHSKVHATEITNYACSSKKNFKELMRCFLSNEYRLAQRAAWSVSWAARQKPEMIYPYIKELVGQLQRTDVHNAVIRNTVRILQDIEIPESFHGEVMYACFGFVQSNDIPIAIKAFSLTTLFHLSKYYPEIKSELKLIIEDRWDNETAAFHARGRKILQNLH